MKSLKCILFFSIITVLFSCSEQREYIGEVDTYFVNSLLITDYHKDVKCSVYRNSNLHCYEINYEGEFHELVKEIPLDVNEDGSLILNYRFKDMDHYIEEIPGLSGTTDVIDGGFENSDLVGLREYHRYDNGEKTFIEYLDEESGFHIIYDVRNKEIISKERKINSVRDKNCYLNGRRETFYILSSDKGDMLVDSDFNIIIDQVYGYDIIIETHNTYSCAILFNSDDCQGVISLDGEIILNPYSCDYDFIEIMPLGDDYAYFETWNGDYELYDLNGYLILRGEDYWISDDEGYIYYGEKDEMSEKKSIRSIINNFNVSYK